MIQLRQNEQCCTVKRELHLVSQPWASLVSYSFYSALCGSFEYLSLSQQVQRTKQFESVCSIFRRYALKKKYLYNLFDPNWMYSMCSLSWELVHEGSSKWQGGNKGAHRWQNPLRSTSKAHCLTCYIFIVSFYKLRLLHVDRTDTKVASIHSFNSFGQSQDSCFCPFNSVRMRLTI